MVQDIQNQQEEIYEINNKKYKVISRVIENSNSVDKLYDVLCKFAISKIRT